MSCTGRLFLPSSTSTKHVRQQNFHARFNDHPHRYNGEVQKLTNILLMHGPTLMKQKTCRENIWKALEVIANKIGREDYHPLYTRALIHAVYSLRSCYRCPAPPPRWIKYPPLSIKWCTLLSALLCLSSPPFLSSQSLCQGVNLNIISLTHTHDSERQQHRLEKWKQRVDTLHLSSPTSSAPSASASASSAAPSPYEAFKIEPLSKSLHFASFSKSNKQCPTCSRQRPLYCWDCFEPVVFKDHSQGKKNNKNKNKSKEAKSVKSLTPFVPHSLELPLQVNIIIHPHLKLRKCTSVHAAVMSSPKFVQIHRSISSHSAVPNSSSSRAQPKALPDLNIPDFSPDNTILLFPSPDSKPLEEMYSIFNQQGKRIERAVMIESTWEGAGTILNHPSIKHLPKVKIQVCRSNSLKASLSLSLSVCVCFFLRSLLSTSCTLDHLLILSALLLINTTQHTHTTHTQATSSLSLPSFVPSFAPALSTLTY